MMLFLIAIILGLGFCFFVILIFGLMNLAKKADDEEEKILKIILQESLNNDQQKNAENALPNFRINRV